MNNRKSQLPFFILVATLAASWVTNVTANPLTALGASVKNADFDINFRYRIETVDEKNPSKDALASTLKSRLTISLPQTQGWGGLIEADNVSVIGSDKYDSSRSTGKQDYSAVNDPEGTDLNQAYLRYTKGASTFTLGRQRLAHGNLRFIGNADWRQNEQTFDAATYKFSLDGWSLDYAYTWRVHRVYGGAGSSLPDAPDDRYSGGSQFLHLNKGLWSTAVYQLDWDDALAASSLSWWLSFNPKIKNLQLNISASLQADYGGNKINYDAPYYHISGTYPISDLLEASLGYEVLGSDGGKASYATPLAALHSYQGFADRFLDSGTADGLPQGIEDIYIGLGTRPGKLFFNLTWHYFKSQEGSLDYGTEIDGVIGYRFTDRIKLQFKYARYAADKPSLEAEVKWRLDTEKAWLMFNLEL